MRLVHWSHTLTTHVHGEWQQRHYSDKSRRRGGPGKPNGLWLSDEARGEYGWRSWCRDERFRPYGFRYEHEVVLVPDAKILYLRTAEDIDEFGDKYGYSLLEKLGHEPRERDGGRYIDAIDWHTVAKKYHGIIITPYIWSQRLGRHMWYYSWDCASGCIWNPRAVASIAMVKERKVPKVPTYWQRKRKHERDMKRMRELTESLNKSLKEEKK